MAVRPACHRDRCLRAGMAEERCLSSSAMEADTAGPSQGQIRGNSTSFDYTEVAFTAMVAGVDSDDRCRTSDSNSLCASLSTTDRSLPVGSGYMACQWQRPNMQGFSEATATVIEANALPTGGSTGQSHTGVLEQWDETQRVDLRLENGQ